MQKEQKDVSRMATQFDPDTSRTAATDKAIRPLVRFNSTFHHGEALPAFGDDDVKREPMLWRASVGFAELHGGPLTWAFLEALPDEWKSSDVVIDSRTHMLMPGWYPCIPGWHLDDVPRSRPDGQPNHESPEYRSKHVMALWGSASVTTFAVGDIELQEPEPGNTTYAIWHPIIEDRIRRGELVECAVMPRRLVFFDWTSFHRGNPATKRGWRFFIRATRDTNQKAQNEVRAQSQVYLPAVNAGW